MEEEEEAREGKVTGGRLSTQRPMKPFESVRRPTGLRSRGRVDIQPLGATLY